MRITFISIAIAALISGTSIAHSLLVPQITEKTLTNGIKVLLIEKSGVDSVHAHIFIKGGRSNTGNSPSIAADLLARILFRRALPNTFDVKFINFLNIESNIYEKIKLEQSITKISQQAAAKLTSMIKESETWDALDSMGASGRSLNITADYCSYGIDLPKNAFMAWAQLEADKINNIPLFKFPTEQNRLIYEIAAGTYPQDKHLYTLLTNALPGTPYAITSKIDKPQAESITLNDIKKYVRYATSSKNIVLIIIGDININTILAQLEYTFGKILHTSNSQTQYNSELLANTTNSPALTGNCRLTINTNSDNRILFGWRIPPINHTDRLALLALKQALSYRCNNRLIAKHSVANKLNIQLGIPGQRDINLLIIEAEPKEGRCLDELEYIIKHEVMRLQQEPLSDQELYQLQAKVKLDELLIQEDAKELAEVLGKCLCQGNDWHLAFSAIEAKQNLTSSEIQLAAQTYLAPNKMTIVSLAPNPIFIAIDQNEGHIVQIFKKLLEHKYGNTIKVQNILEEALRQLRMLSAKEQSQLLKLLENQARL
jgi:predicted Zn-dependent peptidase